MAIIGTAVTLAAKGVAREVAGLFAADLAAKAADGVAKSSSDIADAVGEILRDGSGYITEIVISNETSLPINLKGSNTIHGKFMEKHKPATGKIHPGQTDVFAHTASAGFYGSEGTVVYRVRNASGDYHDVAIGWDNVYSGDNRLRMRFGPRVFTDNELDQGRDRTASLVGHGLRITANIGNDTKPRLDVTIGYGDRPSVPLDVRSGRRTSNSLEIAWDGSRRNSYRVLADEHASDNKENFRTTDSQNTPRDREHQVTFGDLKASHSYGFCVVAVNDDNLATASAVEVFRTKS